MTEELKHKVLTNKNTTLAEWTAASLKMLKEHKTDTPSPTELSLKHAWELGYTPDAWVRQYTDQITLKRRNAMFKQLNSKVD